MANRVRALGRFGEAGSKVQLLTKADLTKLKVALGMEAGTVPPGEQVSTADSFVEKVNQRFRSTYGGEASSNAGTGREDKSVAGGKEGAEAVV